ncbi:unnamed protein product, partial [Urochloa humidicola]
RERRRFSFLVPAPNRASELLPALLLDSSSAIARTARPRSGKLLVAVNVHWEIACLESRIMLVKALAQASAAVLRRARRK